MICQYMYFWNKVHDLFPLLPMASVGPYHGKELSIQIELYNFWNYFLIIKYIKIVTLYIFKIDIVLVKLNAINCKSEYSLLNTERLFSANHLIHDYLQESIANHWK
jgi:hypothetical protein